MNNLESNPAKLFSRYNKRNLHRLGWLALALSGLAGYSYHHPLNSPLPLVMTETSISKEKNEHGCPSFTAGAYMHPWVRRLYGSIVSLQITSVAEGVGTLFSTPAYGPEADQFYSPETKLRRMGYQHFQESTTVATVFHFVAHIPGRPVVEFKPYVTHIRCAN